MNFLNITTEDIKNELLLVIKELEANNYKNFFKFGLDGTNKFTKIKK